MNQSYVRIDRHATSLCIARENAEVASMRWRGKNFLASHVMTIKQAQELHRCLGHVLNARGRPVAGYSGMTVNLEKLGLRPTASPVVRKDTVLRRRAPRSG